MNIINNGFDVVANNDVDDIDDIDDIDAMLTMTSLMTLMTPHPPSLSNQTIGCFLQLQCSLHNKCLLYILRPFYQAFFGCLCPFVYKIGISNIPKILYYILYKFQIAQNTCMWSSVYFIVHSLHLMNLSILPPKSKSGVQLLLNWATRFT